jgi:hypothetical protein
MSKLPPRPEEQTEPTAPIAVTDLRRHFAEIALKLAETEEAVARQHEDLASLRPDRAVECQRIADEARREARRARELARHYSD